VPRIIALSGRAIGRCCRTSGGGRLQPSSRSRWLLASWQRRAFSCRRRLPRSSCRRVPSSSHQRATAAAFETVTRRDPGALEACGSGTGTCQRPVRASGLRAPRVSDAASGQRSGRPALASKSPQTNPLPAWLSAKRTASSDQRSAAVCRALSASVLRAGRARRVDEHRTSPIAQSRYAAFARATRRRLRER